MKDDKKKNSLLTPEDVIKLKKTFMTCRETADYLRVTIYTVKRLVKEKKFPVPVQIGKSLKFRTQDILNFVANKKVEEPNE